jgi:hypothetical protein
MPARLDRADAQARIAVLKRVMWAAPFKPQTTVSLPGSAETTRSGISATAALGAARFRAAVGGLDVRAYYDVTGAHVSVAQLRVMRSALLGADVTGGGGIDYAVTPDQNASLQRALVEMDGAASPAEVWSRLEKRGTGWMVVAAGRGGTWSAESVDEYARLVDGLSGFGPHGKPVIYLYPTREETVTVRLGFEGRITTTTPAMDSQLRGWSVDARPSGAITDSAGRSWPYLFWEGVRPALYDRSSGFVVTGTDSDLFLRVALAKLGLSAGESAEFREYWVPRMVGNRYNLVHFEGPGYEAAAPMNVEPKPDVSIRVFMVLQPLEHPVDLPAQTLTAPRRRGFTLVEWGGTELSR